ncbi:hypothetical protein H4R34_000838 [Dimargaris verticillata]|uniref:RRM domain-containing protein n=1 Tax=Dimargaris verticillata TaxID=2761393 RepID=A0A9W8EFK3_9FUNG|nr:hypothetical protein H4R34_000838 [Dimargaris verticillata]
MGFERGKLRLGKPAVKVNIRRNVFKDGAKDRAKPKDDPDELDKVYKEFVASFEEPNDQPKGFVRGNALVKKNVFGEDEQNTDNRKPDSGCTDGTTSSNNSSNNDGGGSTSSNRFADPAPTSVSPAPALVNTAPVALSPERPPSMALDELEQPAPPPPPGRAVRRKRNLDTFLEELKRGKWSSRSGGLGGNDHSSADPSITSRTGSNDPTTTNLYLGNLHPQVNEESICRSFAKYGPIASVKVMWPRTQEEFDRNRNCGFVSFMTRGDAAQAIKHMDGSVLMGHTLSVGWGKAVPLPPKPIFVLEEGDEPPPTGLPFNAQIPPEPSGQSVWLNPSRFPEVCVTLPKDQVTLWTIHRTIERTIRYGPAFEAMLMDREWSNPRFAFLFANDSPEHVYYRWKLFSIMQGDPVNNWRTKPFYMVEGGPLWIPPEVPFDDHIVDVSDSDSEADELREREVHPKGKLGRLANQRLQKMLRNLTTQRRSILKAMMFVVEHADASDQVSW